MTSMINISFNFSSSPIPVVDLNIDSTLGPSFDLSVDSPVGSSSDPNVSSVGSHPLIFLLVCPVILVPIHKLVCLMVHLLAQV